MKPYIPQNLPIENLDWSRFVSLIGPANREVARFDAFLESLPHAGILISPLTTREAQFSSKIEDIHTTLSEIYEFQADPKALEDRKEDFQEVLNYQEAVQYAKNKLDEIPLSSRLLKETHGVLMRGVRGRQKCPGEFRTGQVFIGSREAGIDRSDFVPPEAQHVPDLFSNLEKYFHYQEKDTLVQLAIIHAQFEIIHPFWDGNGRLGRMLLPLFLYYKKVLSYPYFYISEYLEKHRIKYYNKLNNVSKNAQWEDWIQFFLEAVFEQSKVNIDKANTILKLYNALKVEVTEHVKTQYSFPALDTIFTMPLFSMSDFKSYSNIPKSSAHRIINKFKARGIVASFREASGNRPELFFFPSLLEIIG